MGDSERGRRAGLRETSPSKKLKQLSVLMGWVKDFKWDNAMKAEESEVRERWIKLKRHYHA